MIALEARAPALNRLRSWTLSADQDLFGQWQAVVTFGRIGRRGQVRRHPPHGQEVFAAPSDVSGQTLSVRFSTNRVLTPSGAT